MLKLIYVFLLKNSQYMFFKMKIINALNQNFELRPKSPFLPTYPKHLFYNCLATRFSPIVRSDRLVLQKYPLHTYFLTRGVAHMWWVPTHMKGWVCIECVSDIFLAFSDWICRAFCCCGAGFFVPTNGLMGWLWGSCGLYSPTYINRIPC